MQRRRTSASQAARNTGVTSGGNSNLSAAVAGTAGNKTNNITIVANLMTRPILAIAGTAVIECSQRTR